MLPARSVTVPAIVPTATTSVVVRKTLEVERAGKFSPVGAAPPTGTAARWGPCLLPEAAPAPARTRWRGRGSWR